VARGSLVNLAAMVGGAALSFALVVLVSRWLQPGGAGAFFELIALFTILSNTFELGADTGLTRWISRARAVGGLADLRWIVGVAVIPVMLAGIAAAVAMWIAAPQIAGVFLRDLGPAAGATDIRLVAPLVPIAALSACLVDGSRGFGRMWPYLAIEGIGKPTARIVLVLAALVVGWGVRGAIVAWEIPIVIGLALGWIIFSRVMRKELSPAAGVPVRGRRRAVGGRPGSSDNRQPGKQPGKHGVASSSPVDEAAAESAKVARSQVRLTPELAATLEFPAPRYPGQAR
jgi:O-antigen/teichoic acid export membrane protein